jgi:hypothetical protein
VASARVPWRGPAAAVRPPAAAFLGPQELDVRCDDVGRIALHALLVLVRGGLEPAFDEDLAPLGQVFAADFAELAERRDPVPLGALLFLPGGLVLPLLGGGDAEFGDRCPAGRVADLGVVPEAADDDDLVDASRDALQTLTGL